MSEPNKQLFFVQVKIQVEGREVFDLTGSFKKISKILRANLSGTKCIYSFKVVGEMRIIAAYETTEIIGLERILSGLGILKYTEVTCDPVVSYESFAERIGVDKELTGPSPHNIVTEQCLWADFTVEYPGKEMDELLNTWKQEATAALSARKRGVQIELFKLCGQRKVHVLVDDTAEGWDEKSFKLPLMVQNGNNVKLVTKSLLNLDNYVKQITTNLPIQGCELICQ